MVNKSETSNQGRQKSFSFNGENGEEVNRGFGIKWMPLKMRFMQKMKNTTYGNGSTEDESMQAVDESAKNHHRQDRTEIRFSSNCNNAIRVCADCNTTTTPLWRSGPRGPKVIVFSPFTHQFAITWLHVLWPNLSAKQVEICHIHACYITRCGWIKGVTVKFISVIHDRMNVYICTDQLKSNFR